LLTIEVIYDVSFKIENKSWNCKLSRITPCDGIYIFISDRKFEYNVARFYIRGKMVARVEKVDPKALGPKMEIDVSR
jgi:hypothetical protein